MTAPVKSISTRVRGHELVNEGAGYSSPPGRVLRRRYVEPQDPGGSAVCTCGVASPPLPSNFARKRWHREHKAEVFVCESCGQPAQVALRDGSFWCASCDGAARKAGY